MLRLTYYGISLSLVVSILLGTMGCVSFKTLSLYDGEVATAPAVKPEKLSLVVEPVIFEDDATDVWGLEDTGCQVGSISTDVTHQGNKALKVTWDRNAPGCIFCGIGIGWDGYAGKDLSEIMDFVAIEMHVRSEKGKMFGLPMVLTLEDYSGGMSFSYTGNKYFERYFIDENWQKVTVPLNTFDIKKDGLDATNIKQLQLELQQSGSIYLDDIHLVFYEPEPVTPWLEEAPLPDPLALPKVIFDDAFVNNNAWGLYKGKCQDIALSSAEKSEGTQSVHLQWNKNDGCALAALGMSWNKWHPVDIRPIWSTAAIQFDIKTATGSFDQLPIKVYLEDYNFTRNEVLLTSSLIKGKQYTEDWTSVTIPLSALQGKVNLKDIKHLVFSLEESGSVFIDRISLVQL